MSTCIKQTEQDAIGTIDVVGCIDSFENNVVRGWAHSLSEKPIEFTLVIDDCEHEVNVERRERNDVAEQYGESARYSGFALSLVSLGANVVEVSRKGGSVEVLGNGVRLDWRVSEPVSLRIDSAKQKTKTGLIGSNVDLVNEFTIKGWVLPYDGVGCDIRVFVNGRLLDCDVIHVERLDVARVYGPKAQESGFEIHLPGYMWELSDVNGICDVAIKVADSIVNPSPIVLEYGDITRWIDSISERPSSEENEFLALLAMEHVRYGGVYEMLTEEGKRFISEMATRTRLEDFLHGGLRQIDGNAAVTESVGSIMLREAMLELNTLMGNTRGEIYPLVKQVYKKHALRGTAKEWYLNLAIQLTCATGEFDKLKELTAFRYLNELRASTQPHQLALLLPVLVSNGAVGQATRVMQRIAKNVDKSWLPSACISYAVRTVHKLELEGRVDIHTAERFRLAFVAVLDGFKAGWFSRLHDETLVSTMVELVSEADFYTDYHKRYLITAAIRQYGLSPKFWNAMKIKSSVMMDGELAYAYSAWGSLEMYLRNRDSSSDQEMYDAFDSLEYFVSKGNCDAVYAKREVIVNLFNVQGRTTPGFPRSVLKRVVSTDPAEALRFVAHPRSCLGDEVGRNLVDVAEMVNGLRALGGYHKSAVYEMQIGASRALFAMRRLLHTSDDTVEHQWLKSELSVLERKCAMLGTRRGMFLGADILLAAYQICSSLGYRPAGLLMNAMEMMRVAVRECGAPDVLPAPVCAAIGRISMSTKDHNLMCLLSEMQSLMIARFGNRYNHLFVSEQSSCRRNVSQELSQDVFVVIDTCKEEKNGRIAAIRETWLEDLKIRGIPYLFVVGDGRGEVIGDVLELDVPDNTEAKCLKTLKIFDWIINNTNTQYLVKVSDQCFLDVDRYLDTMSYRRYHYYGKVIRVSNDGIDRCWHKDTFERIAAKKSLDKSSCDSAFVAGNYACSISRHALLMLNESLRSIKGKRLVARTYSDDKLIGDLLLLKNIHPSEEDFDVHADIQVQHPLMPEGLHGNSFLPGKFTPAKIASVARASEMLNVRNMVGSNEIWPKKIWPTCQKPSLRPNSDQLELLTDAKVLTDLLEQNVVVISVVRNEMLMLPRFLEHYRKLGVKCFMFVDNCSDDGTREYLMQQNDVIVYSTDTEYKRSHYGVSWQQAVMGNHCLGKWVLLADADEFLVYEDSETVGLSSFIDSVESSGDNGVLLYMVDMYPYGDLEEADFNERSVFDVAPYFDRQALIELRFGGGMYSNSRNYVNGLRHRLAPARINAYVSQKYALFKYYPWIRLCEGAHYAANMQISPRSAFFAHFKYHSGFKEKVTTEVKRKQHFNDAEEYRKYAAMIAEMSGGFGVEGVSERYIDSHSFVRLAERLDDPSK